MKQIQEQILSDLKKEGNKEKADFFPKFFKTGPGEYGEGDKFLGVTVPIQRKIAKKYYKEIDIPSLKSLITSPFHEVRLTTLFILVLKFESKDITEKKQKEIVDFYLKHTNSINNWDLVDSSADKILGAFLFQRPRDVLDTFHLSKDLWKNRISILSTFYFIRKNDFKDTLRYCESYLNHKHDLIHKATGWMLREIGNREKKTLISFLQSNAAKMPRTMLRYAIEKLPESERKFWLSIK
ncbi:DNA alkylation repair protein [Leptospira meyeri]|uniref:DNA alkylation repair protein n=1 Tax=Leptospira meyeri TaxID=29508 RepID=UPI000C298BC8|nr:DNA alkylation repair protein [Leptospira meyeri]PJZ80844.1 DNA alkylation repair protein [Leptospira meyeri]PJZ96348.1 DNA alkylation repair protein [Leptospira meyeri]PKA12702.1 DNA alkylation repair protein [Leptospira meyeri]